MILFQKRKIYSSSGSLSALAWRRFRKNRIAFGSLVFIVLIAFAAIFGYFISPDHSPLVNEQNLLLANKKPGFRVQVLKISKNQEIETRNLFYILLFGKENKFVSIPFSSLHFSGDSIIIKEYSEDASGEMLAFHLAEICCPTNGKSNLRRNGDAVEYLSPERGKTVVSNEELCKMVEDEYVTSKTFPLGSDRFGRDVLSQLVIGARVSLSVGFISVAISLLIGIFLGALAGYFGGFVDSLISWFINVVWAVPTLLLVIAVTFAIGKGFWQVFVAVGLTMWVEVARVVRGQFLSLREKEFVEAARALGYRNFRIIFRHILPNAMSPVIVISAANFASAILLEAGLSFLGIGVQPPMPSWGSMIKENYAYIILDYAYLAILPGLAIMVVVLAFMLIGNGLRDALDVRTVDG